MSGKNQRLSGMINENSSRLQFFKMKWYMRIITSYILTFMIFIIGFLNLSIFCYIYKNRAWPTCCGNIKCFAYGIRNLRSFFYLAIPFRNASVPISREETCAVMKTTGTESRNAFAIPVIRFVAPGPEVAKQIPGFPVTIA
jgi:hypothetical protein